jgi:hypothetical protein
VVGAWRLLHAVRILTFNSFSIHHPRRCFNFCTSTTDICAKCFRWLDAGKTTGTSPSFLWPLGGSLVGIAVMLIVGVFIHISGRRRRQAAGTTPNRSSNATSRSGRRGTEYERPANVLVDAPRLEAALTPESSPADEIREERRSESRVVHFRPME